MLSTVNRQQSTVNSQPSTVNSQPSTVNSQPSSQWIVQLKSRIAYLSPH
ncbi:MULTISPECIES: hypothetical protein [Calothrix]|uniref:Uncharacterized protein n=2 Tax=Calothrix TaxID=1186 RepID=A0ABR8AKJ1_9CYAN|nr:MULTISPECIES: hypothetical protein [Calothrix]MBD2200577.1 hypothetical protein [Calothrix parietina FACHB-288]MBD2229615.1 hypothetical protein [Calothrix anomala FACHB-343]